MYTHEWRPAKSFLLLWILENTISSDEAENLSNSRLTEQCHISQVVT